MFWFAFKPLKIALDVTKSYFLIGEMLINCWPSAGIAISVLLQRGFMDYSWILQRPPFSNVNLEQRLTGINSLNYRSLRVREEALDFRSLEPIKAKRMRWPYRDHMIENHGIILHPFANTQVRLCLKITYLIHNINSAHSIVSSGIADLADIFHVEVV